MYEHPIYHWPPKSLWTDPMGSPLEWGRMSAYVHFPYCRSICDFCNYETRLISKSAAGGFGSSLADEISGYAARDNFIGAELTSLFFGGGTASLLPRDAAFATVAALRDLTGQERIGEVTLECEPGTIRVDALREYKAVGFNRIGVCAQSFDDGELSLLTRKHTRADSLRLIDDAHAAGFTNLHLDLMYGLPGQTLGQWRATIETAASLPVTHISVYKLYVFKFGMLDRTGLPRPADETTHQTQLLHDMSTVAHDVLGEHGFGQYTLTEFARPGYRCDFLSNTFGAADLLPLGPSAFGGCGAHVWHNSALVHTYGSQAEWPGQRRGTSLTAAEQFKRRLLMGMWLLSIDLDTAAHELGVRPSPALLSLLDRLAANDQLVHTDGWVHLEPHQRFLAGQPMKALADLSAVEWVDGPPTLTEPAPTAAGYSSDLLSALRVLRNDPKLFAAMLADPDAVIAAIGDGLPIGERRALLTAVHGSRPTSSIERALRASWTQISAEHRRVPR